MDDATVESTTGQPIPPLKSKTIKRPAWFSWRAPWNLRLDSEAQSTDWPPSNNPNAGVGGHKGSPASPLYIKNFEQEIMSNLEDIPDEKFQDEPKEDYIKRTIEKLRERFTQRQFTRSGSQERPPSFKGRVTYITKAPEDASSDSLAEHLPYEFDLGDTGDPDPMAVKNSLDQIQSLWESKVGDTKQSPTMRWIHLQANNMQWIQSVMSGVVATCWPVREDPLLAQDDWDFMSEQILRDELWRDQIEMNNFNPMGSRSMTPFSTHIDIHPENGDTRLPADGVDVVVAFMPYLHWESSSAATYMRNVIKDIGERYDDHPKRRSRRREVTCLTRYMGQDEVLLRRCLSDEPSMHPRRTLDQYHYPYFKDTSGRDADQVVERHVIRHHFDDSAYSSDPPILMVDQCWVWAIGEDTVLTAFPGKWGCHDGDRDPLDLHATILKNIKRYKHQHYLRSSSQFARFVLRLAAINLLQPSKQPREHHKFLSFFDHAMSDLRELKIIRFDCLWRSLDNEKLEDQLKELFKVKEEYKMLKEALDVVEESHMIYDLLGHQDQALRQFEDAQRKILKKAPGMHDHESIMKRSNDDTILLKRPAHKWRRENVERLCQRAKDLEEDIRQLLALKQQQASIAEAELTRKLAVDGDKQGRSIMLFTVITIIFLPLSTMASIFGINSQAFGSGSMHLGIIFAYVFPISFVCVVISLSVALTDRGRKLPSKWFAHKPGPTPKSNRRHPRHHRDQESGEEDYSGVSGTELSSFASQRLAGSVPGRATTNLSNTSMPANSGHQRSPKRYRKEKVRSTMLMRPSSSNLSPRQTRSAVHTDDQSNLSDRRRSFKRHTSIGKVKEEWEGEDLASYSLTSSDASGDEYPGPAGNKRLRARKRGRRQT